MRDIIDESPTTTIPLPASATQPTRQGEGLRGGGNGCKHMVTHPFPPESMFLYTLTTSIYRLLFYVVFRLLPPPYPSLGRNASRRGRLSPPTTPHPSLSRVFWWSCPPAPHHPLPRSIRESGLFLNHPPPLFCSKREPEGVVLSSTTSPPPPSLETRVGRAVSCPQPPPTPP